MMTNWPDSREFWRDKRVIVTGGAGFLGSFVVEKLEQRGAAEVIVPRSNDYDLRDIDAIRQLFHDVAPKSKPEIRNPPTTLSFDRLRTSQRIENQTKSETCPECEAYRGVRNSKFEIMEISIKELVRLVGRLTGFEGEIVWDTRRPDGQPRRCLDTSRAERLFGFRAETQFEEGLKRTIRWYGQVNQPLAAAMPAKVI